MMKTDIELERDALRRLKGLHRSQRRSCIFNPIRLYFLMRQQVYLEDCKKEKIHNLILKRMHSTP